MLYGYYEYTITIALGWVPHVVYVTALDSNRPAIPTHSNLPTSIHILTKTTTYQSLN